MRVLGVQSEQGGVRLGGPIRLFGLVQSILNIDIFGPRGFDCVCGLCGVRGSESA
jgi:hypothetical protein